MTSPAGAPLERLAGQIRPIGQADFRLLRELIHQEAGILLTEAKKELLVARLSRRLRALGLRSFRAYYEVVRSDAAERMTMLDCICTNETQFFREPRQFELLEQSIFPSWEKEAAAGRRRRVIRVWSAGCSTGEEPYSLAMALLSRFPAWEIDILATDLSRRALARAERAVWPLERSAEIPASTLRRFMLRGVRSQQGSMKAGPELRSLVRLQRLNLNADHYPVGEPMDLIFCRNVLIYFGYESRLRAIRRLLGRLAPDGYLFLGHSESLAALSEHVRVVMPTVYTCAPGRPPEPTPRSAFCPRLAEGTR